MKKLMILTMLLALALAFVPAPPAQALADACDSLNDTRTDSFGQLWDYVNCLFSDMAAAWELHYTHW